MTKRVDKVEHQLDSIRSSEKEESEVAVNCGIYELNTQILQEVDKEINALEIELMVKLIEDR